MTLLDTAGLGSLSYTEVAIYAVGTYFIFSVVKFVLQGLFSPLAKVPGPWYTRWTGVVSSYYTLRAVAPLYVTGLHEKYGPIVRVTPTSVDVTDPEAVRRIHKVKSDFIKSDWYEDKVYGREDVFNTRDIQVHSRHRKLLSQPTSESSIKTMLPQIEEAVRLTIQRMAEEAKIRGAMDVCKWWISMTTDIIGELSFGESFRMLESGKKTQYIIDLETIPISMIVRTVVPILFYLANYIWVPFMGTLNGLEQRIRVYAETSLKRYRDRLDKDENVKPMLFTKIMKGATGDEGETMSSAEIRDDAMLYIIAGSDTTSNVLTYLTWSLSSRPELKAKVVKEVQSLPPDFSDNEVRELPFLNQCISETMRVFPSVPSALPREVPREGAEMLGQFLPGGTTVTTHGWILNRDPEAFPNPHEFNPSRWENPTKRMKDLYLPFGGGSRICIGMHLAWAEMRLGAAHFFRAFPDAKISKREGMHDDEMAQAMYFIAAPKGHRCLIEPS